MGFFSTENDRSQWFVNIQTAQAKGQELDLSVIDQSTGWEWWVKHNKAQLALLPEMFQPFSLPVANHCVYIQSTLTHADPLATKEWKFDTHAEGGFVFWSENSVWRQWKIELSYMDFQWLFKIRGFCIGKRLFKINQVAVHSGTENRFLVFFCSVVYSFLHFDHFYLFNHKKKKNSLTPFCSHSGKQLNPKNPNLRHLMHIINSKVSFSLRTRKTNYN